MGKATVTLEAAEQLVRHAEIEAGIEGYLDGCQEPCPLCDDAGYTADDDGARWVCDCSAGVQYQWERAERDAWTEGYRAGCLEPCHVCETVGAPTGRTWADFHQHIAAEMG